MRLFRKRQRATPTFRIIRLGSRYAVYLYGVKLYSTDTLQYAVSWAKQTALTAGAAVTWTNGDGSSPVVDYSKPVEESVSGPSTGSEE